MSNLSVILTLRLCAFEFMTLSFGDTERFQSVTEPLSNINDVDSASGCLLLSILPIELIHRVFGILDFRTLLKCREVCRSFRDLVAESTLLQYKIELGAHGLEDGPPHGNLSIALRLEKLIERQRAWDTLQWVGDKSKEMLTGQVWELYGGVLAQAENENSLVFRQLPSHFRGIEENRWTVDISEFKLRDFGMDPSQDLLVIAEKPVLLTSTGDSRFQLSIHLRRLSDGSPHPSTAKTSALEHSLPITVARVSFMIVICAEYLGIMFISGGEGDNEIVIWNWKTGVIQMNITGVHIRAFAFLTDRYVIVASHIPAPIIPEAEEPFELQPNLIILDFTVQPGTRATVSETDYLCSFQCPVLGPRTIAIDINIRSDPAPTLSPDPATHVPFYTARNNRIYVVTILTTDGRRTKSFVMFIPSTTLTSCIDNLMSDAKRQTIQWNDWGPKGTRFLQFRSPSLSSLWVCYVYGTRFVAPIDNGRSPDRTMLRVFDFDPLSLKRAILAGGHNIEDGNILYVNEPTFLNTEGAFEGLIVTSLPYRVRRVALPRSNDSEWPDCFNAAMLSEDNLILVGSGRGRRQFRILSF